MRQQQEYSRRDADKRSKRNRALQGLFDQPDVKNWPQTVFRNLSRKVQSCHVCPSFHPQLKEKSSPLVPPGSSAPSPLRCGISLWHTVGQSHCYGEERVRLLSGSGKTLTLIKNWVLARTQNANIPILCFLHLGNCSSNCKSSSRQEEALKLSYNSKGLLQTGGEEDIPCLSCLSER